MNRRPTILLSLNCAEEGLPRLRQAFGDLEIRVGPWIDDAGQTMPEQLLRGVEVLFCSVPPQNFDEFDQLKWIQLTSAGYGQVLDLPILQRGIRVTNGRGNFDIPIAEWNVMMLLMWERRMPQMMKNHREHVWDRPSHFQGQLHGRKVGFYGYGGLARQTARILKVMGVTVWALTRDGSVKARPDTYCVAGTGDPQGRLPDRVFGPDQLQSFLTGLDYLVLAVPLTSATEGLIGEAELRMLQPSAVLLNPTRAQVIQQEPLIRCMTEGWIRGASIDVHYAYPLPPEHPMWSLPNLLLTPHVAGDDGTPGFLDRLFDIFMQNVKRYRAGQPLLNELTEQQLRGD